MKLLLVMFKFQYENKKEHLNESIAMSFTHFVGANVMQTLMHVYKMPTYEAVTENGHV